MKPMGRIDPRWPVYRGTSPKLIRPKPEDSRKRSHESELTRTGLSYVGRNFPLAYFLMGLPGLLLNGPTSRREHPNTKSIFRSQILLVSPSFPVRSLRQPRSDRRSHIYVAATHNVGLPQAPRNRARKRRLFPDTFALPRSRAGT